MKWCPPNNFKKKIFNYIQVLLSTKCFQALTNCGLPSMRGKEKDCSFVEKP
jgi:hypothetical protein